MSGFVKFFYTTLLISMLISVFHVQFNIANPEMITVPDTYLSIQEAIDHARPGGTIYVKAGIYLEHIVVAYNNLKIVGENRYTTIIDGQGIGTVVYLKANGIVFDGFTIKNSGFNFTDSGIYIDHSINSQISDNNVIDNNLGLYLYTSSNITLRNNSMFTNRYNFGVYGDNLQEYIHDIDATNLVDGKSLIYWVGQSSGQPPLNAGYVAIVNSSNVTLQDLTLSRNWQAVLFAYSTNSSITNVTATMNMDCIWILNCTACTVTDSDISGNSWGGVAIVNSSACSVYGNSINDNAEYGVLLSDSSHNLFYHNNFTNNTSQVWFFGFNSNNWDDGYPTGGNFWSNQGCTDVKSGWGQNQTGSDGICDLPFVVDSNNIDRYPLTAPWVSQSLKSSSMNLTLCVVTGIVIILGVLVLYLIKTRKQKPSI
jgi:parallel beta-helix repeat protein